MKGLLGILSKATGTGTAEAERAEAGRLGWKVGTFALERLEPADGCAVGSNAVWEAYCAWCAGRQQVPLAFAVFHAEFEKVAEAVGIDRRQIGAHVSYQGVGVKVDGGV